MPVYNSSGVYVVEKDLSQVVPTTSTSVGAIVLHCKRGEINKPKLTTNTQEYITQFGNPHPSNGFGAYAALAFLERSSQLYVVRVVEGTWAYSGAIVLIDTATDPIDGVLRPTQTTVRGVTGRQYEDVEDFDFVTVSAPSIASVTVVVGGGSLTAGAHYYKVTTVDADGFESCASAGATAGGVFAANDQAVIAITRVEGVASYNVYGRPATLTGTYGLIGNVVQPGSGNASFTDTGAAVPAAAPPELGTPAFFVRNLGPGVYGDDYSIKVSSANLPKPSATATNVVGGGVLAVGTYFYKVTAVNSLGQETNASTPTSATLAATGSVSIAIPRIEGASYYKIYGRPSTDVAANYDYLDQVTQPSSGNATYIDDGSIVADVPAVNPPTANFTNTNEFTLSIYDTTQSSSQPVEEYTVCLEEKLDGFGQQMEIETRVNTFSNLVRVKKNDAYTNEEAGALTSTIGALAYGDDGDAYSAISTGAFEAGWDLFADPEEITVRILIEGGTQQVAIQNKMNSICLNRKDCVAILDVPTAYQEATQAVVYRRDVLNMNSNRAALYSPDLRINDPYNDLVLYVPPSGHVAGVYAFTDASSQVWYAPAGLNRGVLNVLGVRYKYNQAQRDLLAPSQINYVRNFPGLGIAVWEQITLQSKTSALSYVSVRRMLDTIEVSVSQALLFSNQEPNDDFLKRQIVTLIAQFLEVIKNGRGIADYAVISDSSNNPPQVANSGQLNVDCYIQPILPARIIQLQMIITKQGVSFQELIANGGNV